MGVGYYAIVFVGLEEKDIPASEKPMEPFAGDFDKVEDYWKAYKKYGEDMDDKYSYWEKRGLEYQYDNGYDPRHYFVGKQVSETDSYGFNTHSGGEFIKRLADAIAFCREKFGKEPNVYVIMECS